jgi:hypothetical protein
LPFALLAATRKLKSAHWICQFSRFTGYAPKTKRYRVVAVLMFLFSDFKDIVLK